MFLLVIGVLRTTDLNDAWIGKGNLSGNKYLDANIHICDFSVKISINSQLPSPSKYEPNNNHKEDFEELSCFFLKILLG